MKGFGVKTVNEMIYATIFNRNGTDAKKLEELGYDVETNDDGTYSVNGWHYWHDHRWYSERDYILSNNEMNSWRRSIQKYSRKDFRAVDFEHLISSTRKPVGTYMYSNETYYHDRRKVTKYWSRDDKLQNEYERNVVVDRYYQNKQYLWSLDRSVIRCKEDIEEITSSIQELQVELEEAKENYNRAIKRVQEENPESKYADCKNSFPD